MLLGKPTSQNTQKISFSNSLTDAIYVTSVFNLYEFTLSLQLNDEPLRSEPQWIFLSLSRTYYYLC